MRLDEGLLGRLDVARGGVSRTAWVEGAIEAALGREGAGVTSPDSAGSSPVAAGSCTGRRLAPSRSSSRARVDRAVAGGVVEEPVEQVELDRWLAERLGQPLPVARRFLARGLVEVDGTVWRGDFAPADRVAAGVWVEGELVDPGVCDVW